MQALLDPTNRLFTLARSAQRLPHLVVAVMLSPVFLYGSVIAGSIVGSLLFEPLGNGGPVLQELGSELRNITIFGLMALMLALWLRGFEGRQLWTLGLERKSVARPILVGWLVSVVMIAVAVGVSALVGGATATPNLTALGGLTALALSLIVIPSRFVQGGAEELIFRGWMLPTLGVRYRPWIGVLVSSVVFSILHVANAGLLPLAILNIALIGLFIALYALREGSLWGVLGLHAGLNWAQTNLFGLSASGHTVGATLMNVQLTGSELITGGAFGIENSLTMTVVMVIAVGVEVVLMRRTKASVAAGLPAAA
ncbi:MAG TPA: CPBP family intramembrane glutamic endopeptidase [Herpetosiphonaceae bacterium]|nr:CPBP family intramembrane glutamic endopeptidase [Herpetosiphonaceae bacterium]